MKAPLTLIKPLTAVLSDTLSASLFLRTAHWNVEGSDFFPLHAFYGEQYELFDENADTLAERILALGSYARPQIDLRDPSDGDPAQVIKVIAANRDLLEEARAAAASAGDAVTENMLLPWIEARDKALWMLKAHRVG